MLLSRIFHITIQSKIALKSLIETHKLLSTTLSNDSIRSLLEQQSTDLEKLRNLQYLHYRIPPAFITSNLTKFTSIVVNPSIFGLENASKSLILDLHEIIEGNIDESLILMNEAGFEEKELRKVLCDIRDEGHDICDKIKRDGINPEGYGYLMFKPYFWMISNWL